MRRRGVLILLQNLPLAKDARVKRECRALLGAGFDVTVICPRGGRVDPVPGVRLRAYPAPPEAHTAAGFVLEYAWSLSWTALLALRTVLTRRVDIVQACNPPDIFWLVALPLKALGVRFVFDHHDLSPELWAARSGRTGGVIAWALRRMESVTLRVADHVVATNDSVRQVAFERGGRHADAVTVVRNGPELDRLRPTSDGPRRPEDGERFLAVWLGVIGVDDGVEDALSTVAVLVHELGRTDCGFVFIGDGERLDHCRRLVAELEISAFVRFTGWMEQDDAYALLRAADIALAPDPPHVRAQHATMMKVLEYMAVGLPIVAFDVHETRVSAAESAVYADEGPESYARAISMLLDDPERRARMAVVGRERIRQGLSWDHQQEKYVRLFEALAPGAP